MDIFRLSASLFLDTAEYERKVKKAAKESDSVKRSLDQTSKSAGGLGGKFRELAFNSDTLKKSLNGMGNVLRMGVNGFVELGKATMTASAVAGAAIATIGGFAVKGYADYQQLTGGVETLFGTSAKSVQEYAEITGVSLAQAEQEFKKLNTSMNAVFKNADQAYKTAGMSANQYMETVTSFSASLLQSLGGDTVKAADYADMAIKDMSDNANKMGTSMESIQFAYQGFAKQNYTMLDNLKLGYGGTKQEMERLVRDAAAVNSAVDENSLSFGNIVLAINTVQKELGIYGTTAKEANETVSGSLNSLKASWKNLLTDMANNDFSRITQSANSLQETLTVFLGNIIPVVKTTFENMLPVLETLAPTIFNALIDGATTILPKLAVTVTGFFRTLVTTMSKNKSQLANSAVVIFNTLITEFLALMPQVLEIGLMFLTAFATSITENLPTLIPAIQDMIYNVVMIITNPETLLVLLNAAVSIITALGTALIEVLPLIVPAIVTAINQIVTFLSNPETLLVLLNAAIAIIMALANGLIQIAPQLIGAVVGIITQLVVFLTQPDILSLLLGATLQIILAIANGLIQALPQLMGATFEIINQLILFLLQPENLYLILQMALVLVMNIALGLIKAIPQLLLGATKLIGSLIYQFTVGTDWLQVGKDIMSAVWDGLVAVWNEIVSWFKGAWNWITGGGQGSEPKKPDKPQRPSQAEISQKFNSTMGSSFNGSNSLSSMQDFNSTGTIGATQPQGASGGLGQYNTGTAPQVPQYTQNITVNQNISSKPQSAADLMEESIYQLEQGLRLGM